MQVNTKNGNLIYKLTKTDIRTLTRAADLLTLMARCDHKSAGDLSKLVRGIATAEECAAEPETKPDEAFMATVLTDIMRDFEACEKLVQVGSLEKKLTDDSRFSDENKAAIHSIADKQRERINGKPAA